MERYICFTSKLNIPPATAAGLFKYVWRPATILGAFLWIFPNFKTNVFYRTPSAYCLWNNWIWVDGKKYQKFYSNCLVRKMDSSLTLFRTKAVACWCSVKYFHEKFRKIQRKMTATKPLFSARIVIQPGTKNNLWNFKWSLYGLNYLLFGHD